MKPTHPKILTINGGSSSIKFALFEAGDSLRRILACGIGGDRTAGGLLAVERIQPGGQLLASVGGTRPHGSGRLAVGLDRGTR